MSRVIRTISLLGLGLALASCAGRKNPGKAQSSGGSGAITRAEMEKVRYSSLYEVVQALRARWLQSRGPTTFLSRPTEVQVMVDEMRMGGIDALRGLRTDNVVSIAFFDPVTAAQRWGGKHAQGTILVTTRADGVPQ